VVVTVEGEGSVGDDEGLPDADIVVFKLGQAAGLGCRGSVLRVGYGEVGAGDKDAEKKPGEDAEKEGETRAGHGWNSLGEVGPG
jgi:hypothetical protein